MLKVILSACILSLAVVGNVYAKNVPAKNECGNRGNNCPKPVVTPPVVSTPVTNVSDSRSSANAVANGGTGYGGSANARQDQSQTAVQSQNASQGQSQSSTQGNTQSSSVGVYNNTYNPDDVRIRNTPDAVGYAAMPSATCIVTGGAGIAMPGFGGSVSGGTIDKACVSRENARILAYLGQEEAALRVMCRADEDVAAELKGCGDIHKRNVDRANERARNHPSFQVTN